MKYLTGVGQREDKLCEEGLMKALDLEARVVEEEWAEYPEYLRQYHKIGEGNSNSMEYGEHTHRRANGK